MSGWESIIDFFKNLKKPEVCFFTAIMWCIFAPYGYRFFAVLPAAVFMGWLWNHLYEAYMWNRNKAQSFKRIKSLSEEEIEVLNKLRKEQCLRFHTDESDRQDEYDLFRKLEQRELVECTRHLDGCGQVFYIFLLHPLMKKAVCDYFREKIENKK